MSRRTLVVGAGVGALGAAGGLLAAAALLWSGERPATSPSAADVGFCADMSAHHVQALAMCQRVLGRDTGDPVQAAAGDVLQNQAIELGQMRAWLADWGESTATPQLTMAWMGHGPGVEVAMMPGYASGEEMAELSTLTGTARGRRWLELMRAHHVGGIERADAAVGRAEVDKVRQLARAVIEVQTFEIEQYDILLTTTYAATSS